jgi:hypothetical protein
MADKIVTFTLDKIIEECPKIIEECPEQLLNHLFAPIKDLSASSTKAEIISYCLNKELGAYGFQSYASPDKTMVLINDDTMCQIVDFFNQNGYQPYFTKQQVQRVKTLHKVLKENNIDLLWAQTGLRKKYYYLKQFGFNGINLYNALMVNTVNVGAAAVSKSGATALSISAVVAMSWSGSMFLSLVEPHIPNTMPKVKFAVSGAKFVVAIPIRLVEWTSNNIFGFAENLIIGSPLPTNVTEVYRYHIGPKIEDIQKIKKPVIKWLIKTLHDINLNDNYPNPNP